MADRKSKRIAVSGHGKAAFNSADFWAHSAREHRRNASTHVRTAMGYIRLHGFRHPMATTFARHAGEQYKYALESDASLRHQQARFWRLTLSDN